MAKFLIKTLVIFENTFLVEGDTLDEAQFLVQKGYSEDPDSQRFIDETILDSKKITNKEFEKLCKQYRATNET